MAVAGVIAALGLGTTILAPAPAPAPAKAAVFVGFGFGFPFGFPGYYYPPYPYYPPPSLLSDTAGLVSAVRRVSAFPRPGAIGVGGGAINHLYAAPRLDQAEGQFCREYKSNQGVGNRATERYGTACRDASGQWRIVN